MYSILLSLLCVMIEETNISLSGRFLPSAMFVSLLFCFKFQFFTEVHGDILGDKGELVKTLCHTTPKMYL